MSNLENLATATLLAQLFVRGKHHAAAAEPPPKDRETLQDGSRAPAIEAVESFAGLDFAFTGAVEEGGFDETGGGVAEVGPVDVEEGGFDEGGVAEVGSELAELPEAAKATQEFPMQHMSTATGAIVPLL
ncbi:hypothetical protein C8R45DRAFT_933688 [Mycena sanguinolenta]|nr:hypothetical protein C8R45DRAFT_933688 [Mycena sanguinolenta]